MACAPVPSPVTGCSATRCGRAVRDALFSAAEVERLRQLSDRVASQGLHRDEGVKQIGSTLFFPSKLISQCIVLNKKMKFRNRRSSNHITDFIFDRV